MAGTSSVLRNSGEGTNAVEWERREEPDQVNLNCHTVASASANYYEHVITKIMINP